QAEDGIRYFHVTGVQTCALPISFDNLGVYPRPYQSPLPVWLAAGGTPSSAVRAAQLGLPLMLAIIGGMPEQFVGFIDLYKETAQRAGRRLEDLRFGINNHFYVTEDSQIAGNEFYPYYSAMMNRVGKDRGWPPLTRQQFEFARSPRGA